MPKGLQKDFRLLMSAGGSFLGQGGGSTPTPPADTWSANNSDLSPYDGNLVAYWPLSEATGTSRYDVIGTYEATDNSSLTPKGTGKYGDCAGAFEADNSDQLLVATTEIDIASLIATKTWTISLWFKVPDTAATLTIIDNSLDPDVIVARTGLWSHIQSTGRISSRLYNNSGTAKHTLSSATGFDDGNWHHLAIWCASGSFKQLVDGTQNTVTATINVGTGWRFSIGGTSDIGNSFDGGYIDEVAIWNTTLPDATVAKLYNSGTGAFRLVS